MGAKSPSQQQDGARHRDKDDSWRVRSAAPIYPLPQQRRPSSGGGWLGASASACARGIAGNGDKAES